MSRGVSSYRSIALIYLGAIFLALHYYLVIYIDSSFLGQFVTESQIGIIYIISATLTLLALYKLPGYFRKETVKKVALSLVAFEFLSLLGLGTLHNAIALVFLFTLHVALPPLLLYCLDIYLEKNSPSDETGLIRALYLTLMNCTLVASPFITGLLVARFSYNAVYIVSGLTLIPFFLIVRQAFSDPHNNYAIMSVRTTLTDLEKKPDIRDSILINFTLQFFYAIMVVYMPIYLHNHIGFSWPQIAIIFTVMLMPFIIFELPLGRLADKRAGEKEILITGFSIIAFSTFFIGFLDTKSLWMWAAILFTTRVGASFVEIASDTYFFKKVTSHNTDLISLYRGMMPLSYVVAPLLMSFALFTLDLPSVFTILGILMILGIVLSSQIKDTN